MGLQPYGLFHYVTEKNGADWDNFEVATDKMPPVEIWGRFWDLVSKGFDVSYLQCANAADVDVRIAEITGRGDDGDS